MKVNLESGFMPVIFLMVAVAIAAVPCARAQWTVNGTVVREMVNAQRPPRVVPDGAGGAIVVWKDFRYGGWDIYAQRIAPDGTMLWGGGGAPVCTERHAQHWISMVPDGAGGALAVWMDMRRGWDIYGQHIDSKGGVLWKSNGNAICLETGQKACLVSAGDGAGGSIVVWVDMRSGRKELIAQHVNGGGKIFWGREGIAFCRESDLQWHPAIVMDGEGGAIVAWQDRRDGTWDIHAQRLNSMGESQWNAAGVRVCAAPEDQFFPVLVSDGDGGALVAWYTRQRDDRNVFMQRIDASGDGAWRTEGVAVSTASGSRWKPRIAPDTAGGAIVAWVDDRNGNRDIFAQRIDAAGALRWHTGGVALCTAAGDQWAPEIIADGEGGAIVTWHDMRDDYRDVYAQRIGMSGAPLWAENGVAICTEAEPQVVPQLVIDDNAGAIVVWLDLRKDDYTADIYAGRVDRNGVPGYEGAGTVK